MKKLICAVAAVAAGVAMADGIQSANIVGYSSAGFDDDGQVLRGASFITIGVKDASGNDCVRLSDLKVVGYTGDINGGVYIAPLKKDGSNQTFNFEGDDYELLYSWYDTSSKEAGWYGTDEEPMKNDQSLCGNADDIKFAVGQGVCIVVGSSYAGCSIQSAGQVLEAKSSFVFPTDGQNLVCTPLCRRVSLDELTISGYTGDINGGVYIAPLKKDGSNQTFNFEGDDYELLYSWYDTSSKAAGWYGTDEEPMKNDQSLCGNADEIFYDVGDAMCIVVGSSYIGCQIDFPSLSASK